MNEVICRQEMGGGLFLHTIYEPVQELVRCKDCKYWSDEKINDYNKCEKWINVGVKNFATIGDWFCAEGKKERITQ